MNSPSRGVLVVPFSGIIVAQEIDTAKSEFYFLFLVDYLQILFRRDNLRQMIFEVFT
jgi:hypothetical protein